MKYVGTSKSDVEEDLKNVKQSLMILAEGLDDMAEMYRALINRVVKIEKVTSLLLENMGVEVDVIPATESKVVLKKSKKRK